MTEWPSLCAGDTIFVALGSNLGDRAAHLAAARAALAELPGTTVLAASDVEETAPLGPAGQGPYLNQMVAMQTSIEPLTLLDHLHDIERARGRERRVRWGARTLDLDIVCFGDRRIAEPRLAVPHPELANRAFWRREMAQAAARIAQPPAAGRT
jgi:2-amino-4-hydroxy-6-hydroxymethyldihydropteridine diphosphokinase